MFRERYNGRQQALFHVLAAYSVYNTEVGYCQGMYTNLESNRGEEVNILIVIVV